MKIVDEFGVVHDRTTGAFVFNCGYISGLDEGSI